MRRLMPADFGLVAFGAAIPAHAANIRMPVKAPAYVHAYYNWTGFYLGAHIGYGWADFEGSDLITGAATGSLSTTGFIYGGQLGYNYQIGSWVLSIEADFTFGDVKDRQDLGGGDFGEVKLDRAITAAARVGYAFDRTLLYLKAGAPGRRRNTISRYLVAPPPAPSIAADG